MSPYDGEPCPLFQVVAKSTQDSDEPHFLREEYNKDIILSNSFFRRLDSLEIFFAIDMVKSKFIFLNGMFELDNISEISAGLEFMIA